jgi:hypothetical protein
VNRLIRSSLVLAAISGCLLAATPAKPKKKSHPATKTAKASVSHAKKPMVAPKSSAGKTSKAANAAAKRKGKKSASTPTRYFQQAPTPERYTEIQQALAAKGYFKGEANGHWGDDSMDAMKRFQADQNLMPDGKIGSLSLIALGLGPKRLTAAKTDPPPPPGAPPASASPASPPTSSPTPSRQ